MKTARDFLRDIIGPEPCAFINYTDALKAVQAVIDHYEPVDGLELLYRVKAPELPLRNVLPLTCPNCLKRVAACSCLQPPF